MYKACKFSTRYVNRFKSGPRGSWIRNVHTPRALFKEAKAIGTNAWRKHNQFMDQVDIKRDISLFIARYSSKLGVLFKCDGCLEEIRGCWYKCLHCIDMNFCVNCYKTGRKPSEHLNLHEIIELRLVKVILHSLRKKCPYSRLFWSVFSHIRTEYREIRSKEQNNSKYGYFYAIIFR